MARPKIDHNERRAEIARAACDVILERGLENAKLSEIASRAGVTTGAVQHYFRSKEDLLLYAKNDLFDQLYDRIRWASAELTGVDRLLAIASAMLPTSRDVINAYRVLEAFRGRAIGNASLLRIQHKRDRRSIAIIEEEIKKLARDGLIASDIDSGQEALALSALLDGLGATVMAAPKAFGRDTLSAIIERYIERVLGITLVKERSAPRSDRRRANPRR